MAVLETSPLFGDQHRVRVASPAYAGHCISWDYPLLLANSSSQANSSSANNASQTPVATDSSIALIDDEFHRVIYFSGTYIHILITLETIKIIVMDIY